LRQAYTQVINPKSVAKVTPGTTPAMKSAPIEVLVETP
jgi:hypothetical protein